MKQLKFLVATLLLAQLSGFAQTDSAVIKWQIREEPRFFINIHAGYAWALGSTFKFYPDDVRSIRVEQIENNDPRKTTTYQAPTRGLGQGFRIGAGIAYIVNDFVNVGVDIDYFQTTISKTRDSSIYRIQSNAAMNEYRYREKFTISYDATLLTISPNIMLKAISRPKFFVYNKVGLVVTFRPNSLQKETTEGEYTMGWQGFYRDSLVRTERTYEWGIRNPSVGFMGGVGSQVRISERIRIFGEVQFSHIVFVVRARSLTSFKQDGTELIKTLPVMERELQFEKNLSSTELNDNPSQPMRTIIQRIPITYVGLQTGVVYRF